MRKFIKIDDIKELPKKPGIYLFKNSKGEIFYVGKTINIKSRVMSHKNDNQLFKPEKIDTVEWIETINEIEALLKESEYIKKLSPRMNIRLRDDKKYFYVGVTKEDLPRVFITHQPAQTTGNKIEYLGPYTDGKALKVTLKYLRRLFPYYTTNPKRPLSGKTHGKLPCSYCHLGLCPGPEPDKEEYKKNIKAIKQVLRGRRKSAINSLKKEMKQSAKEQDFEKAGELRDVIHSLENIFSHSTVLPWDSEISGKRTDMGSPEYLAQLIGAQKPIHSIEGYDISNIQGKEPTASMVRFDNGAPNKSMYRKFNIKAPDEPNDYLMMAEVIRRRLKNDWPLPDLMLIDGGRGQLNAAIASMRSLKLETRSLELPPVVSLAKREEELYLPGRKKPIPLSTMPQEIENLLRYVRDEAHRFAVSHHRKKHGEKFK